MKRHLVLLLSLAINCAFAQLPTTKKMADFLEAKADLWQKSYEKRDTKTYEKILNGFSSIYESLPADVKEEYRGTNVSALYTMACIYSLNNSKKEAINYLSKTILAGKGYYDYRTLLTDPDLTNIRNELKFKSLMAEMKELGDYLYLLRKASSYNTQESQVLPKFTYQSKDIPELVTLNKTFKLDSIAGAGSEVSKILNLLHWIHNLIPHDGINDNPKIKNALSMINVCKNENRGLNCRGLAVVLNECYLSMGFKSRYVTCYPKDSLGIDSDVHVINEVFSTELKKWIWIDPTNNAYVMNEKGELLSIEEVRQRLIDNGSLILNPDANWNNKESKTKEDYLFWYMAKNLYRLQSPISSEFNYETSGEDKKMTFLELVPIGYINKTIGKKTDSETKIYQTNNPNTFWEE